MLRTSCAIGWRGCAVGKVKIKYYRTRRRRNRWLGYWIPTKAMKKHGFKSVPCGDDGPEAWAIAEQWNARWQAARKGVDLPARPEFPPGTLGEAWTRYRQTATWANKKPRTREDWERGWKLIVDVFGDVKPGTISFEDVDSWYAALLETKGIGEAYRAMKIWRALWQVAASMKVDGVAYCDRDEDPSFGIRRKTPRKRNEIWTEGEAVRLVKRAWRMGYQGLAAALAVAWDTMLSPVDVRGLTRAQRRGDEGSLFELPRAKTGRAAIGTLSKRTMRLVEAYVGSLPGTLHPSAPIFRTRGWRVETRKQDSAAAIVLKALGAAFPESMASEELVRLASAGKPDDVYQALYALRREGRLVRPSRARYALAEPPDAPEPLRQVVVRMKSAAYTKDKLAADFRAVRQAEFPGDRRKLMDFRRSGAVEATAGSVDPAALAGKMANSIDTNKELQATYLPHNATLVKLADKARVVGRRRLRENGPGSKS